MLAQGMEPRHRLRVSQPLAIWTLNISNDYTVLNTRDPMLLDPGTVPSLLVLWSTRQASGGRGTRLTDSAGHPCA